MNESTNDPSKPQSWRLTPGKLDPEVYESLRVIARSRLRSERANHTLTATALAHEALMKVNRNGESVSLDRKTLLIYAANAMRQILVDHARSHRAQKHGGGRGRVDIDDVAVAAAEDQDPARIVMLNDALANLAEIDARSARVVELKFFGGLTFEEIAEALDLSVRTVKNDWKVARMHLTRVFAEPGQADASDTACEE